MLFTRTCLAAAACELPPNVMTSEELEARLSPVYDRLGLPYGRLELMTGIKERRFWDPGVRPSTVAAAAGRTALEVSGIDPDRIGCLIHASVCRDFLEPASASVVHRHLKLPENCAIFDLGNACLGVLNGMAQVAAMIESGQIEAGLVVSGEVAEPLHAATIKRLLNDSSITRKSFKLHFASLTIGSGAAGVVLCREDLTSSPHRLLGGALRTDSSANQLCQEDTAGASSHGPLMATDSEALLHAGVALAKRTWQAALTRLEWGPDKPDHLFTHQVGVAHSRLLFENLGLDPAKDFPTVQHFGNTGSAALPTALARGIALKQIQSGETLGLLGIGSGLSSLMLGIEW